MAESGKRFSPSSTDAGNEDSVFGWIERSSSAAEVLFVENLDFPRYRT